MKITFILLVMSCAVPISAFGEQTAFPLKDGHYIFAHKFAEAEQHNIESIKLDVEIKGNQITVTNNDSDDVFPKGLIDQGTVVWHRKSKQWIIAEDKSDENAEDVGGCSDGPTVIDPIKRIYWTC